MGVYNNLLINAPGLDRTVGTGWVTSAPDIRDYTENTLQIQDIAKKIGIVGPSLSLPSKVDFTRWFPQVQDQGELHACNAFGAAAIIGYFQKKAFGKNVDISKLFIYKNTKIIMGLLGNESTCIRATMGALALCGFVPERYWPYRTNAEPVINSGATFDSDPPAFVYAIADNYKELLYFSHGPEGAGAAPSSILFNIKKYIAAGIPTIFGFNIFETAFYADIPGAFAYPCSWDQAVGGHSAVVVGYDDKISIKNTQSSTETKGALLVRNSWGTKWGNRGYGWIPYDYILSGMAQDFWSIISTEWVDTNQFGIN